MRSHRPRRFVRRSHLSFLAFAAAHSSLLTAGVIAAIDDTWVGSGTPGTTTAWNIPSNWSNGSPGNGQGVNFGLNFTTGSTINLVGANPISSFTINTAVSFTLNPDPNSLTTPLTMSGGFERLSTSSGTQTIAANVMLNNATTWGIDGAGTLIISGNIAGQSINKTGAGTLVLSGSNTYASATVSSGTLAITSDTNLGNSTGVLTLQGGTVRIDGNITFNRAVTLNGTGTLNIDTGTTFVQGGVTGTGTFVKTGAGRLRFFGGSLNTYSGTVINMEGQILTNFTHLTGDIQNFGELQLSQTVNGSYSQNISGSGTLIFGGGSVSLLGSNTFSGPTFINDTHVAVSAAKNLGVGATPITLNNNATVLEITSPFDTTRNFTVADAVSPTIQADSGTSSFTGAFTGTGTLTKTGAGELRVNNMRVSGLTINQGTLAIAAAGGNAGTSQVSTLTFGGTVSSPTGVFDLADNGLAIDYPAGGTSPLDSVRQEIKSAYANGSWNGQGLTSSKAAASAGHRTALGYAEASAVGDAATFGGVSTDASTVVVQYTLAGDANLDGKVNMSDFTALASKFGQSSQSWVNGDFNYDGVVNLLDLNALATNFGQPLSSATPLGTIVPEPAALASLALAAFAMRRRKHRR
ncbi:MAG TPA: autotransporter-associated beta strand repeat-containing protein [Tepidisphaeraceae bacterium]|nr:autotransporter-associated beta strand repeat-containing protein [Tepidisphaeraceae bacterium]